MPNLNSAQRKRSQITLIVNTNCFGPNEYSFAFLEAIKQKSLFSERSNANAGGVAIILGDGGEVVN